ncbi:uncharacterized protein LOC128228733 [Mya arenaria]|uniref:uncharacterized protein LOC128228733 n=1 Tax=Mya arenaria TaxID=6604 RepID=UPI0022DEB141|nr:uncharacterized protein LOC128228733 [Mya arenaria]
MLCLILQRIIFFNLVCDYVRWQALTFPTYDEIQKDRLLVLQNAFFSTDDGPLNIKKLVNLYYEFCPRQPSPCDTMYVEHTGQDWVWNETLISDICRQCSCKPDCMFQKNCCPGSIFGYMKTHFVEMTLNFNYTERNGIVFNWFYFIQKCFPILYHGDDFNILEQNCNDKSKWSPVTSNLTGIPYYNYYCAQCNGVFSYTSWSSVYTCTDSSFEPFSAEKIRRHLESGQCYLMHFYGDDYNIDKQDWAFLFELTDRNLTYERCNETGLWEIYDPDVDFACKTFVTPYKKVYSNVFCYICNPSIASHYHHTTDLVIDTCPEGLNETANYATTTPRLFPFKNIYYLVCNGGYIIKSESEISDPPTWQIQKSIGPGIYSYRLYYYTINFVRILEILTELKGSEHTVLNTTYEHIVFTNGMFCKTRNTQFKYSCANRNIFYSYECKTNTSTVNTTLNDSFRNVVDFIAYYVYCLNDIQVSTHIDLCKEPRESLYDNRLHLPCLIGWNSSFVSVQIDIHCPSELEGNLFFRTDTLLDAASKFCNVKVIPNQDVYEELSKEPSVDECYDIPWYFGYQSTCRNSLGNYELSTFRRLFAPNPEYFSVNKQTYNTSVAGDLKYEVQGKLVCAEGRVIVGTACVYSVDVNPLRVLYVLQIGYKMGSSNQMYDFKNLSNLICDQLSGELENKLQLNQTKSEIRACSVFDNNDYLSSDIQTTSTNVVLTILQIYLYSTNSLTVFENTLVDSITMPLAVKAGSQTIHLTTYGINNECSDNNKCMDKFRDHLLSGYNVIHVNKFLACPMVEIPESNYTFTDRNKSVIFHDYKTELPLRDVELYESYIRVCVTDVLKPVVELKQFYITPQFFSYKVIDSLCTTVSFICMILSLIVYFVFKELRNTFGINNMSLIFCLLSAQTFAKFGLWATNLPQACVVFGFCIHYFWLSTFLAMNVCAYHIFRVFVQKPFALASSFSYKLQIKYAFYIYCTPFLVLVTTFLVNYLRIGMIGYGTDICFINDRPTQLAAFLLPITALLIINVGLFLKTIIVLRRSEVQSSSRERNYFKIYIKVSALLGITWPLIIVDAMFEMSVFSYLALAASSLQGVYIFIAFTCNMKVWGLVKSMCFCLKRKPVSKSYDL